MRWCDPISYKTRQVPLHRSHLMLHILIASIYASPLDSSVLPGCDIYQGLDSCQGSNVNVLAAEDARSWQTPPRGAPGYKDSFQDYREITGSPNVVYSADRSSATVTLGVTSRTGLALQYSFDNGTTYQSSATVNVGSTLTASILAIAKDSNGATLKMEPIDLLWNNAKIPNIPQFRGGQKGAIVDLFGWKWADIEKECPMLAKAGYLGAKINPPNEHLITQDWLDNSILNPWYYVYQPVSYRLHSRGGSRAELRSMIQTCRALGVRIYADAVINHMTGGGNDIQNHRRPARGSCVTWGPKSSTGGSPFYTFSNTFATNPFTNARPGMEYPGVPWKPTDFHCDRVLNAYNDPLQLDAGWLVGLVFLFLFSLI